MTVVTRFAPSPTGYLHIGGVRTALYSWLHAKHHGGRFILRIEDTDVERSTKESVDVILEGMQWLGLDYDGPYFQTDRLDRYRETLDQLLSAGKAYRCYCSKERLTALREEQEKNKQKPRYDGHCRDLKIQPSSNENQPFVVRFRSPTTGEVSVHDEIRGRVIFQNAELDDLVILRSDGMPTYNFAVVIDDWDMKVTHVIRGDDHLNNTPRQIHIFEALGAAIPSFAHVPMILGPDGKRLSKRHGAVSVLEFRNQGFLPEALLNYLVRLGWAHGDQEVFSIEEMVRLFDVSAVNKAASIFDPKKLLWLNQVTLQNRDSSSLIEPLKYQLEQSGIGVFSDSEPPLLEVINILKERAKTLAEMAEKCGFFYEDTVEYNPEAFNANINAESVPILKAIFDKLEHLEDWDRTAIHESIDQVMQAFAVKMGAVAQPIRVAVTGDTHSPPIDATLELLGRERVLERLHRAIEKAA